MNTSNNMNDIEFMIVERMVMERMNDIQREAKSIRMLRDAGLSKPGLYERVAVALGNTLVKLDGRRRPRMIIHNRPASSNE